MTKRIFRTIFVVAISIFLVSALLFMTVLYDYFSGIQQSQLHMQIDLASQGVEDEGLDYLQKLHIKDYRITWIGTDGKVLYDSVLDINEMENHFEREEVTFRRIRYEFPLFFHVNTTLSLWCKAVIGWNCYQTFYNAKLLTHPYSWYVATHYDYICYCYYFIRFFSF